MFSFPLNPSAGSCPSLPIQHYSIGYLDQEFAAILLIASAIDDVFTLNPSFALLRWHVINQRETFSKKILAHTKYAIGLEVNT